jgi:hypothetical protein
MAGRYALEWDKGDSISQVFTIRNSDQSLFNLTGYDAEFLVAEPGSDDLLLELNTDNGGIVLGGAQGTITLITETDNLTFRQAVYNLRLISPSGSVWRIMQGTLCLSPEVEA